jgi:hydroxymethylpyrimidine pyrophosphatase-like HAD family hydrolase
MNNKLDQILELLLKNPAAFTLCLDFDDALDITTQRNLSAERRQILWDLNRLTNGGVLITTNSDGRSIFEMPDMAGFPVISEFGTVLRNIPHAPERAETAKGKHNNKVVYLHNRPNCKKAFEAAVRFAKNNRFDITNDAAVLNGDGPVIKIEKKEMGLAFVFGKHASMKDNALKIAEHAFEKGGFSEDDYIIEVGADAVEIKRKDASKANIADLLAANRNYKDRGVKIALGDSGSDLELMQRLGYGVAVGDRIKDEKLSALQQFARIESDYQNFDNVWAFLKRLRDGLMAQRTIAVVTQPAF